MTKIQQIYKKDYFTGMETKEILLLVACFLLVGFSLYRKYVKKSTDKNNNAPGTGSSSQFSSSSKDDDYEPYSGTRK